MQEISKRDRERAWEARYRAKLKLDPVRATARKSVQKTWRADNPELRAKYDKARTASWIARRAWMIAFRSARRRATKFGLEFALTHEWAAEKFAEGSPLSGLPFVGGGHGPYAPSIDRIDSSLGYTVDNSRMLLRAENLFKNEWSDADIIEIARAITLKNVSA